MVSQESLGEIIQDMLGYLEAQYDGSERSGCSAPFHEPVCAVVVVICAAVADLSSPPLKDLEDLNAASTVNLCY